MTLERRLSILRFAFWAAVLFAFTMAVVPQPPQLPGAPSDKESSGRTGPDRALQRVRGRAGVREVRRPDGPHRLVLHVPRLRHEHRLQLSEEPR